MSCPSIIGYFAIYPIILGCLLLDTFATGFSVHLPIHALLSLCLISIYIITGGAIKLTATMQERQHTLSELQKMEQVRNFLISEGIIDNESFIDYMSELE